MKPIKNISLLLVAGIVTLSTAAPTTVILQQGLDGYSGCTDRELRSPVQNYDNGPVDKIMKVSEL